MPKLCTIVGIMRGYCLWGVAAFATPMLASQANAQTAVSSIYQPQLAYVTVRGQRAQNLRFEIYPYSDDGISMRAAPAVVCREPCHVTLPPGGYKLKVAGPADGDVRAGEIPIEIDQDSEVVVKTTSQGRRSLGLKVGIVGSSVAAVAGAALFVTAIGSMGLCTTDECRNRRKTIVLWETISLGVMAVGGTAALLGWIALARNNAPAATVAPIQERRQRARLSEIGLLHTERAWGLSAAAVF